MLSMCFPRPTFWLVFLTGLCWCVVDGIHVAFVLPPASPRGAMLPVACGALEAGHTVSLLAYDDDATQVGAMIPGAQLVKLGPTLGKPDMDETKMDFLMGVPYALNGFLVNMVLTVIDLIIGTPLALVSLPELRKIKPDVLCVANVLPSGYHLGEVLGIPVVGLGFTAPWALFGNILQAPWSLEPPTGSFYTREEIVSNPALLAWNTAVRLHGFLVRCTLGFVTNNRARWKLGLSSFEFSQHESILANPMIVPSLPELAMGYPTLMSTNVVMAGLYDHPMLAGASLGKSAQHHEIMSWLDGRKGKNSSVLYCAFGSEVVLNAERAESLLRAFGKIAVLWVLKKRPPGLSTPPANVFITAWSPQKAVLAHPAVKAFLSHGGANSVREAVAEGVPMLIMPFFGDSPLNAVIHEELGVAIRMHKKKLESQLLADEFVRITGEVYQQKAAQIKSLNDKFANLTRAVEVIENVASRRYPMRVPQQGALLQMVPIFFLMAVAFLACKCCRWFCLCCCSKQGSRGVSHKPKRE